MTLLSKRFWQRGLASLLALVMAIVLGGCDLRDFRTEAAQVSQIVARTSEDPSTYNYALLSQYPNVFTFTFEGLIGESGEGVLEPALAESWQVSDDKLHVTFTLREGLKWSDGEPLTVEDVLFSFNEVYFNEEIPTDVRDSLRIGQKRQLPKLRQVDDRRVEFTTPEPFAPFLRSVGYGIILPAHILRQTVKEKDQDGKPKFVSTWGTDTDPNKVVVNGPYRIVRYTPDQRVVFERNPYYWRKDEQGNQLPYIQRLVWQIVDSPETAAIQFRSGGLDVLDIGPSTFSLLKREEKRGNFTIYNGGPNSGETFIAFNLNQGKRNGKPLVNPIRSRWFNTVAFRQAVAYGINRQAMINNIMRGLGAPQDSPISVQSPYYLSPEAGLKVYNYDPEKSKQLLKQAGFKYNAQGELLDADNNRVRFTLAIPAGGRTGELYGSSIKRDLAKIGIQVDLQAITFSTLVEKLNNSLDLECYFLGFTGGVEPYGAANLWLPDGGSHSFNQKPMPGQAPIEGRVVADWEAEIGDLFIEAARELDEAKRKEIYAKFQQMVQEYLPLIHLVNPLVLSAVRNRVEGVDLSSLYYEQSMWNVAKLKVVDE
jgi:peptide/nickel transport system substrate-binding protein